MAILSPSLLAADFGCLREDAARLQKAGADWLHFDVMDGHFVPNITFGPQFVAALRPRSPLVFDVHLMIEHPLRYAKSFAVAGADYLTFHLECGDDPRQTIDLLHDLGVKVGISVKPGTDVKALAPYLPDLDLVLVMSVEPGFGGQSFMPDVLTKVAWLAAQKREHNYDYLIEIDGGVNRETGALAVAQGCEVLVAGTAVFRAKAVEAEVEYYHGLGRAL